MIVTEEEAKTKWCPESLTGLYAGSGAVAVNRHCNNDHHDETRCIGTACMAWRWADDQEYEHGTPLQEGSTPTDPGWEKDGRPYREVTTSGVVMWQRWRKPIPGRRGYCGKAGRPF